jgi:hypothetical protein
MADCNLTRFYVVTPQYESGGDYYEPPEWGADVVEVEARSKREAVTLGVKLMLTGNRREFKWCRWQRGDGANPFAGVKAYPVGTESEAGS